MMNLYRSMRVAATLLAMGTIPLAHATHLVGGNLGYTYVGETSPGSGIYRYTVYMEFYLNCGDNSNFQSLLELLQGSYSTPLEVGCYIQDPLNPGSDKAQFATVDLLLSDSLSIIPDIPDGCTVGDGLCTIKGVFTGTLDVPLNLGGYHLYFQMCCRNLSILNIDNPNATGIGYYAYMPPPLVPNSSPVWLGIPTPFLCTSDTATFLNAAIDPDGDQLIFSFEQPYNSYIVAGGIQPPPPTLQWPVPTVTYSPGFSLPQPFGAGGYAYINGSTGLTQYHVPVQGNYVVSVEVKEYRFGQLIGRTRRDLQLQAIPCPPNTTPATAGPLTTFYEVNAGDLLCFDMNFVDADGDSLFLVAAGTIFDGSLFSPPATIGSPDSALAAIGTTFCWDTQCDQGQSTPYLFSVSVSDNGCPPKTVDVVVQVQVNPFLGPVGITGPTTVCTGQTGVSFSTTSILGASYTWGVTGGTIAGGQGTNTVTIDWGAPGIGLITVFATDSLGCSSSPISLSVNIVALPNANAGPDITTCPGTTVTLGGSPTGPPGSSYLWSPAADLNDATLANPDASPPPGINTYIVQVSNGGCVNTDTVLVEVYLGVVSAGPDQQICFGDTAQLNATGGSTYVWTPNGSLSDSTIANPLAFPISTTTYSVEGLDSASCLVKDIVTVFVNALPIVDAGADTTFCPGTSVIIGGAPTGPSSAQILWSPSTGLSAVDSLNPVATPPGTITYTVTVTDTSGCVSSDQITLTQLAIPDVDAGPDQDVCAGDTIQLQGSGTGTLLWTPATGLSDPNVPDPFCSPETTTTYTLTSTGSNTCVNTDQVTITVNLLPSANGGPDKTICIGDTVQIGTSSPGTFTWTPATGLSATDISTPLAFPIVSTTYYVSVSDTNACAASDSVHVTVNLPPDAGTDGASTVCSTDAPVDLFALLGGAPDAGGNWSNGAIYTPGGGGGVFTYTVNGLVPCPADSATVTITENIAPVAGPDAQFDVCSSDTAFSLLQAGIDSTGTWYDPNSTVSTGIYTPGSSQPGAWTYVLAGTAPCVNDTAVITVNELPALDAGLSDSVVVCGSGVAFNLIDSLGGAPDVSGTWTDPSSNPHGGVFDPAVDPDGTYTYTVAGGTACEAISTLFVSVQDPFVDAGPAQSICIGDTAQLNGAGTGALVWTPGTTLSDSLIANPLAFPIGTTTYTLTLVDVLGCVNSDQMTLTVNPLPNADAGSDVAICDGDDTPIGGSPTGPAGSTFSWTNGGSLSSSTAANPTASPAATTTYVVTVNDVNSCSNTDTVIVTVNPLPFLFAGNDTAFCSGGSVQLNAQGSGDFLWTGPNIAPVDVANPVASPTNTTTYTVTLTDPITGCVSTDDIVVSVLPLPTVDAGPDLYLCPGFDVQLQGSGSGGFSWSPAALVDNATSATPQASPVVTTVFTLTVTDGNGCQNSDVTTVNVNTDPQVDAGSDITICLGETVQIGGSPTSVVPGVSFLWSPSTDLDDATFPNPNASPDATITYTVTVTSDTCTNSDQVTVTVQGIAQAAFNVRLEPNCDGLRAFFNDLSTGAIAYAWDFNGDGITDSEEQYPQWQFLYGSSMVVTLTITDIYGCTGSVTQSWPVGTYEDLVDITVPNVFTPNGDGVNDIFTIESQAVLGSCTNMFIFNRWGQKVFESFGSDIVWSGRNFSGEECTIGTYFYVIRVKDMEFNGDIYLNR